MTAETMARIDGIQVTLNSGGTNAVNIVLALKWFIALPLFLCALPSYSVFYRLLEYYRVTLSEFRLLKTTEK